MSATEQVESTESTELAPYEPHGLTRLRRHPVIDQVDEKTLGLIASQVAQGCSRGELGHFLELCAHYDLDPFAKEAWCAKGKNGKLLIMVGRDGLRKIAQRQGLHVDGDVVRENDDVTVSRTADGDRSIAHSYGNPAQRGDIVGAWAEVREGGPTGRPMGYFYAPLDEYRPVGASDYSPWKKQVGVMILAAAERQAIRQATPLGGLMAIGEDEVIDAVAVDAVEQPPEAERVTPEEVLRIMPALEETGWTVDEQRMQLVAVGAQDVSDVAVAIGSLTKEQAHRLLSDANAAIDAASAEA